MEALKSTGNTPVIRSIRADNKPQNDTKTVSSGSSNARSTRSGIAKTRLKIVVSLPGVSISLDTSDNRIIFAMITACIIYALIYWLV